MEPGKTGLNDRVEGLKGVGPKRAKMLAKLGIRTIGDLLGHFPRDYRDRSQIIQIGSLEPGDAAVKATVTKQPEVRLHRKLSITRATVTDGTGTLDLVWYNQPYMKNALRPGQYMFSGNVTNRMGRFIMESPEYEEITDRELLSGARIVPVYPLTEGLSQKFMRRIIKNALELCEKGLPTQELLPDPVILAYNLYPRHKAVYNIHYPVSAEGFFTARRTLVFTEFFLLQTSLFAIRGRTQAQPGITFTDPEAAPFLDKLPYKLTKAQVSVLNEIKADVSSGFVMNRLIQGDVGSGKTAVAMAAMYLAYKNGWQSAFMAPTETLARQHFKTLQGLFEPLGIHTALLTGSMTKAAKDGVKTGLVTGTVHIIVGTHALIVDDVAFAKLGLVICDEQHRFGVRQRGKLSGKGTVPHVLVMSATPIPRTLALILYGDLDISVIGELPPGRLPINTTAVNSSLRPRVFTFIKKQIEAGRQAYIVCPVIEENEGNLRSVKTYAKEFTEATGIPAGILHGKLSQNEKNAVTDAFVNGGITVLVATTVIEVGIDVPNATVMLIENAERFGLAQLHQLRGRVGRGGSQSYCVLITDVGTEVTKKRMKAMTASNDGFVLSDLDLSIRGPGDFFGTRQHGLPELKIANLYRDNDILKEAQEAAKSWADENGSNINTENVSFII